MSANSRAVGQALHPWLLLPFLPAFFQLASAAYINFDNCLPSNVVQSNPLQLQWVPLFVDARFDRFSPSHNLNVTFFGNVSGRQFDEPYPPPDSPRWSNPNDTFGKIAGTGRDGSIATTEFARVDFLNYNAWTAPPVEFCKNLTSGTCPIGPLFTANASDPSQLYSFSISHEFQSSYAFSTLVTTVRVVNGESPSSDLACVSANVTPDLGTTISRLLTWLPAAILILKAIATLAAAIYSPWGSSDIFRWSSNYGRDEDLLRLVTPGFGDCLQYIQFVTLTGGLSLKYPGYFQPAVSQTSWSCLLFNESFVSHGSGVRGLVDGIYVTNATYGMQRLSELVGMSDVDDIWACMAIWLLVIAGSVVILCQLGFFARWIYRNITGTSEEDLRRKNLPFTLGNMIRLMFNFFILPIVALSFFQLVIAAQAPISVVVLAVILLVVLILSAIWIMRFIFTTKPRTFLFDDMPTVLLYGPLYNTYSDSAAPFALVPVFITFVRGVAFGAVQPSGTAQIIILAICEVILILTLNGLRPFQGQTSMNLYHTIFSSVRLVTILLSVAFASSLGVTEATKGWIGYVILILHACVLVFGFFLNAAQTLLEIIARSFGVGGDSRLGAVRGSILTQRMLKRRQNRPKTADGSSLMSSAAILQDTDAYAETRSRSLSASSQQLLNQAGYGGEPSIHRLSGFENFSNLGGDPAVSPNVDTESTAYGGYAATAGKAASKKSTDITNATENFYRPPRVRRGTIEALTPAAKSRELEAGVTADVPYSDSPHHRGGRGDSYDSAFYHEGRSSPAPAYFRDRADSDDHVPRPDYAVREVDQYYRGPALSDAPTRKLKTGPADPEGPAANAQSWFQRLAFGVQGKASKQKEPSKGFEVVRSTRLPPEQQHANLEGQEDFEMVNSPPMHAEPYRDSPPSQSQQFEAVAGAERGLSRHAVGNVPTQQQAQPFNFGLDGASDAPESAGIAGIDKGLDFGPGLSDTHPALRPSIDAHDSAGSSSYEHTQGFSGAPMLAPVESVGGIDLPSRFNSQRTSVAPQALSAGEPDEQTVGQDWLHAVDNISWGDHSRGAGLRDGSSAYAAPRVPERSPRRPMSSVETSNGPPSEMDFPDFDRGHDPLQDVERPTSVAVRQHRAADSITRNSLGAQQVASAAEMFGDDHR